MNVWEWIGFSKQQLNGCIYLLGLIGLTILYRNFAIDFRSEPYHNVSFPPLAAHYKDTSILKNDFCIPINRASQAELEQLPGIGPVLSRRIIKYRKLRGGFHYLEELQNVYGIKENVYYQILPYLYVDAHPTPEIIKKSLHYYPKKIALVPINQGDSAAYEQLPGIGPVLSQRIIRYREAIGGFDSLGVLKKVYGLKAETYARILPYLVLDSLARPRTIPYSIAAKPDSIPKTETADLSPTRVKIDLNRADSSQLVALPGIGAKLAHRILRYKQIIGFYSEVSQLRKVYGLSEENYQRMQPYLAVQALDQFPQKDLNTISHKTLKYYPFLSDSTAKVLLKHRRAFGHFANWEEVAEHPMVDDSLLSLLKLHFRL